MRFIFTKSSPEARGRVLEANGYPNQPTSPKNCLTVKTQPHLLPRREVFDAFLRVGAPAPSWAHPRRTQKRPRSYAVQFISFLVKANKSYPQPGVKSMLDSCVKAAYQQHNILTKNINQKCLVCRTTKNGVQNHEKRCAEPRKCCAVCENTKLDIGV